MSINQPSFYTQDFDKYKKKVEKDNIDKAENPLRLKGNAREYEHILFKNYDLPTNPSQIGFDSTLRQLNEYKTVHGPSDVWKTLNKSEKKNLLDNYLPPLNKNSIRNMANINQFVSRPYEAIKTVNKFKCL